MAQAVLISGTQGFLGVFWVSELKLIPSQWMLIMPPVSESGKGLCFNTNESKDSPRCLFKPPDGAVELIGKGGEGNVLG